MNKVQNHTAPVSHRPRTADRLRKGTTTARRVLRGLLAPVPTTRPVVATPAPVVQQVAAEPTNLFAADELPALAEIEAAAEKFLSASEQGRTADRVKRASRKLLDRLPAGRYGMHVIERVENAREVADLDAIRAIFAANNLGELPMRRTAASLKIAFAPELAEVSL